MLTFLRYRNRKIFFIIIVYCIIEYQTKRYTIIVLQTYLDIYISRNLLVQYMRAVIVDDQIRTIIYDNMIFI